MMPQSTRILTTACPKPAVPLADCQREYGKATRSASPRSSKYTGTSSFPPIGTVQRPGFSIGNRAGYLSGFTNAACAPSLASNGKSMCQRSPQESQPAQHRVHLASGAAALGWPRHKDGIRMPKAVFFSALQEEKRDRGAPRKRYKDQVKRQLAQAGITISHGSRRPQTETAGGHQ